METKILPCVRQCWEIKFLDHFSLLAELMSLSLPSTFTGFLSKKKMKSTSAFFIKAVNYITHCLCKRNSFQSIMTDKAMFLWNQWAFSSLIMSFSFHCQEVEDKCCAQLQTLCEGAVRVLVCFIPSFLSFIFILLTLSCKIIISYSNSDDKLNNCGIPNIHSIQIEWP